MDKLRSGTFSSCAVFVQIEIRQEGLGNERRLLYVPGNGGETQTFSTNRAVAPEDAEACLDSGRGRPVAPRGGRGDYLLALACCSALSLVLPDNYGVSKRFSGSKTNLLLEYNYDRRSLHDQ